EGRPGEAHALSPGGEALEGTPEEGRRSRPLSPTRSDPRVAAAAVTRRAAEGVMPKVRVNAIAQRVRYAIARYRMAYLPRSVGPRAVVGAVRKIMFGPRFLADPTRAAERERLRARLLAADCVGLCRATLGVVRRRGVAEEVGKIRAPTLVLVGKKDVATVPEK